MTGNPIVLVVAAAIMCAVLGGVNLLSNIYSLDGIKDKTVGHGQHGTARWASKKEIRQTYQHIPFTPERWRKQAAKGEAPTADGKPLPQGIVVGCTGSKKNTTAMVDTGDVHVLMIGAAGVGKTAFWLYPCIEYACASGMSFLSTDTKGDVMRNYGNIAKEYGYKVSVIDLRNPTRSNGNNLLHLVNKYMDLYKEHPDTLVYKAKAEKYAKIISKTIILSGMDAASFGQNAYFYDAAEGLLTATILLVAEFCEPKKRHIVSVFKIIQELLAPSQKKGKNQFQQLMELLPNDHKAKWFAGAALNTAEQSMASVMSTALSRLNSFLDSELEQLLCFDTEIDAEKFCNEKSAIFIIMPEENPNTFFMISLIIQQLYREILAVADEQGGKLKNRCVFFCDEFGTLPKIESAEMMFSASRSRRLQIVPIIQSFSQLDKNYGKEGAEIIVDNLKAETRYIPKKVIPTLEGAFHEKVAIIGAGPAGLSCAFFLAEKGYSPVIFEKNEKPGGMLRYGIPSFKLEKNVIDAEIDIIKAMGVEIKCGIEVGKDVTLDQLRAEGYKAFYIAIGCQGGRLAGIPGEEAEGVMTAVDFLRTVGQNEDYPVSGKAVVVGGGNVAIDVTRTAQRCGAESVSMFCLEPREKMPASEEEIAEAAEEGVAVNCGWGPKEVLVEDGKVKGIVFKKCISVWDENGRFAPAYDENDTQTIACDRVFLSIGQAIQWGSLLEGSKVELGLGSGAKADSLTYQTAEPDIFVGGDVYTGPKFAIDAIAAGREGAISIHRFVQPHSSLTIGRNRRDFIELDKQNIHVEQYDNSSRQIPGKRSDIDHKKSFRDSKLTFTEEQVKKETARCLGCGASVVDPNKCIGCGVCTVQCKFDAIHLHRERPECSKMVVSEDKLKYILGNGAKQAIKLKFAKKK